MTELKVYHSIIDSDSLQAWLGQHYAWPVIDRCRLLRLGLNDTYEVSCPDQTFIVRIYRAAWRSISEVRAEMEALAWLKAQQLPIAAPLTSIDGQTVQVFHTTEGERCLVAFEYIEGQALTLDVAQAAAYGRQLAQLHRVTDAFDFEHPRFRLDAEHLIHEPLRQLTRAFAHHRAELAFIQARAQAASEAMQALSQTRPLYGFCHGDHFGNVLQQEDHRLVMIDFDCCGLGYRVYDVVQFYWALKLRMPAWRERFIDSDTALWQAFLQGYHSVRQLHEAEWQALPAMLLIRALWGLALQPHNEQHWGSEDHERIWQHNLPLFYLDALTDSIRP
jgi:Ser/Thr protein kinase RdoA (MazF antagonist)